jgi:LPS-assembly protein
VKQVLTRFCMVATALCGVLAPLCAIADDVPAATAVTLPGMMNGAVYLEADEMNRDQATGLVTATGEVQAKHEGRTVRADVMTYNPNTGIVVATGNVVILNPDGTSQYAEKVELDDKLAAGIATGFAMRTGEHGALAAASAIRRGPDVNVLKGAVYTACDSCHPDGSDKVPTWAIRADKIVQNRAAKIVSYKNARLLAKGVPVFYTPVMWHPDPSADRASGFLVPDFGVSSRRGVSIETPYLFVISPSQDIVVSPQISEKVAPFLNLDWRKRFYSGEVDIRLGGTYESEFDGDGHFYGDETARSYILGKGLFDITPNWRWGFGVERASDDFLTRRYDIGDVAVARGLYQPDDLRLLSQAFVDGAASDWHARAAVLSFQGMRIGDDDATFPTALPLFEAEHSFEDIAGGRAHLGVSGVSLQRGDGTDSSRISASGDWRRLTTTVSGLAISPFAYARGDMYRIVDNPLFPGDTLNPTRLVGAIGTEISLPMFRPIPHGNATLEPVAQLVWATDDGDKTEITNEDSQAFELDDSNLLTPIRASGYDIWEDGLRLDTGVRGSIVYKGMTANGFVGRSWRQDQTDFPAQSGLRDGLSDWVGRFDITPRAGWRLASHFRFDGDTGDLRRIDTIGAAFWDLDEHGQVTAYARHLKLRPDDAPGGTEELSGGFVWQPKHRWGIRANLTRDVDAGVNRRGELALTYRDECTELEVAYVREETDDPVLGPSDAIKFRVLLATLGQFGER